MKISLIIVTVLFSLMALNFFVTKDTDTTPIMNVPSFEERLKSLLDETEKKYKNTDQPFVINIADEQFILFQIVDRTVVEHVTSDEFGYVIHLSFDNSFPETVHQMERFKKLDFASDFHYSTWEDTPTYQLDVMVNQSRIIKLAKEIIQSVYGKEASRVEVEELQL